MEGICNEAKYGQDVENNFSWYYRFAFAYTSCVQAYDRFLQSHALLRMLWTASAGKYKVIKTIGSSAYSKIIEQLFLKARQEIDIIKKHGALNFDVDNEKVFVDTFFNGINDFKLLEPELILGIKKQYG